MARQSEEFILAWQSLSSTDGNSGWRTIPIAPSGRCLLSAGRRFPGNEEALLVRFPGASLPAADKLPEGQGFNVERVDLNQAGTLSLALSRKSTGSAELFLAMACDVAGALDAETSLDPQRSLRGFLGRVRAWQEFMRTGGQALSAEAETGLIGELTMLSAIVETGMPPAAAIESWVGPLGGTQDFLLGTGAIEVKATLASSGFPARIVSLDQLDDSVRQPLFLAGLRFRQHADGRSLPESVADLRSRTGDDTEAGRMLAERLLAAGYLGSHAGRYSRRVELAEMRILLVTASFPRLTHATVPAGIFRAAYELDLDRVHGNGLSLVEALQALKVL
ncbi:PD-(D/E)XK motif protein [Eleftheria terrae]|uniref:PD-(D/E)XK motif protein n=1 Tax=Eleftheria terrae TaxID=1597781 RepID=UPI00263A8DAB|nr:PD-(D/E)XK motif protein [Eleftheria terrae]WKB50757.1 PD-(D/E)XK motif protein [Eleftheria terrae]